MAITYLGEQHFGSADDANVTTDPLTLDKDVAPFSTLSSGDVVIVEVTWRVTSSISVLTTGGQTWTEHLDFTSGAVGNTGLYSCVFNGTWDADPQFDLAAAATGGIGWAVAYSGVDSTVWDVTPAATAQAASTTFVEATYNTVTDGALAVMGAYSTDNNTWTVDNSFTAPSGSGNMYWRNIAGSDSSMCLATKTIPTAGAVGATTMTQATLGGDAGHRWHGALKPAAAGADQNLTGSLFTKAPTFFTGTISAVYDLTGALFTKAPTFFTGTITTEYTLTGTLFAQAPTFFTGAIVAEGGDQSLTGTLFQKAPTFSQGAILAIYDLTGTLFSKAPTFSTGTIQATYDLVGTLFTKVPTFFTGAIAAEAGEQTLTGVLFVKAPTFFVGSITSSYELAGVLFTKAPTFAQGQITTGILAGPVDDPNAAWIEPHGEAVLVGTTGKAVWQ